ncbi:MAG: phage portal protein [Actinomycetota bacterium]|nr:phage portal protein [Actinomycetota bacterium]
MSLFGLFDRRSVENPAVPLTSGSLEGLLGGAAAGGAGVPVSEISAMRMPTVYRAVSVIAGVASSLPLHTYTTGTKERAVSALLDNPHPELTPLELWRLNYMHRALWGNGYLQKVRSRAGDIVELWPVRPSRVKPRWVGASADLPGGKLFEVRDDKGNVQVLSPREILHIPGLGYDGVEGCSPIRLAAEGIGLALGAERSAARLFGRGNIIGGVLQTEQRLSPDQAAQLKAQWRAKMSGVENAQEVAVLDSGATFKPVTMPYREAQFLESRQFQIPEIARMFGVPLFLLMETSKSTSWGTGLEQQSTGFVTFDLGPTWLAPTEQRIRKELLPPSQYARYAVQGLMRGDSSARATWYRAMRDVGAFSANDIRELEDLTPIGPDGDIYLQPMYMGELGINPADPPVPAKEGTADED